MKIKLKRDIVIPAGTVIDEYKLRRRRWDEPVFDLVIGLGPDSIGFFVVGLSDVESSDWFEIDG